MSFLSGRESLADAPLRVLGIGGSTRADSRSLILLRHALRVAETAGAGVALGDVRRLALPMYDDDLPLDGYPPSLRQLLDSAREADASSSVRRRITARSAARSRMRSTA